MAGLQTGGFNLSVMPQFQPLDPRLFQGLTAERATESFRRGLGLTDELRDRPETRALQGLLRQLQQAQAESQLGLVPAVTAKTQAEIADTLKEIETRPEKRAQEAADAAARAETTRIQQAIQAGRLAEQEQEIATGLQQDRAGMDLASMLANLNQGVGTGVIRPEVQDLAASPIGGVLSQLAPLVQQGLLQGRELAEPARDMAKTKGRGAASDADLPEDIREMKVGESRPIPDPSDPKKRLGVLVRTPDGTQIRWDSNVGLGLEDFQMRQRVTRTTALASELGIVPEPDETFEDWEKRVAEAQADRASGEGGGTLAGLAGRATNTPPPVVSPATPAPAATDPNKIRVSFADLYGGTQ